MKSISNPIIPVEQIFYKSHTREIIEWGDTQDLEINYSALATFSALGFMLDDDTFFKEIKTSKPATQYKIDEKNIIVDEEKYWQWHYNPRDSNFSDILEEFTDLFEILVKNQINNNSI